jgi:hypothetical protein
LEHGNVAIEGWGCGAECVAHMLTL